MRRVRNCERRSAYSTHVATAEPSSSTSMSTRPRDAASSMANRRSPRSARII
jgi:hypothetical protein